jgi:hypothetical protein
VQKINEQKLTCALQLPGGFAFEALAHLLVVPYRAIEGQFFFWSAVLEGPTPARLVQAALDLEKCLVAFEDLRAGFCAVGEVQPGPDGDPGLIFLQGVGPLWRMTEQDVACLAARHGLQMGGAT